MKLLARKLITATTLVALFSSVVNANEDVAPSTQTKVTPQTYSAIVDNYFSPYTGSALSISGYNLYKEIDDYWFFSTATKDNNFFWGAVRAGKVALDYSVASFFLVFQHEIFGHGYRARELDLDIFGYRLGVFSGSTTVSYADYLKLSYPYRAEFAAAGIEANTILAQEIRQNWFIDQTIEHRDAVAYFINSLEQMNYVYITQNDVYQIGNDIQAYISDVNYWYQRSPNQNPLSLDKLRARVWWDLLDPALWYSVAGIGMYIYDGTQSVELEMLNIKGYNYLPSTRAIMAPYGMEFQLQNHIRTPRNQVVNFNLRYGENSGTHSYGIDFIVKPIWKHNKFVFGNRLFLWRQPKMTTLFAYNAPDKYGIAEYVNFSYSFTNKFVGISEIGYKTPGFIQGEPLGSSVIVRLGFKTIF